MMVEVRLGDGTGEKEGGARKLHLPDGVTVGMALDAIDLPAGRVNRVEVNGVRRGLDHLLANGDRLALYLAEG